MDSFGSKGKEKATADDGFFMERLEILYDQNLADLRAFAEREGRAYDEVKRHMAQLHCRWLFDGAGLTSSVAERKELIGSVLRAVSQQLESLETIAGLQSFFLVVDPNDLADEGFLGGTVKGREFWRGHRGCGLAGAQAFKARCGRTPSQLVTPTATTSPLSSTVPLPTSGPTRKKLQAREVKSELYGAMRDALRAASGMRNAEMKWTNHSKLDSYGVKLVGWPENVPRQNPSTLAVMQNKLLLDLLSEGKMFFSPLEGAQPLEPVQSLETPVRDEDAMFEDSINYSWVSEETQADMGIMVTPPPVIQADKDESRALSGDEIAQEGSLRTSGTTKKRRLHDR